METVALQVNGTRHEVDCDPATPLLYVLRNDLGLTGAKLGCGLEQCGACAVLVDGESVPCCNRPVAEFAGRKIVTVEALSGDAAGRAVQGAFVAEGAAQCGYCTAGLVVAAKALVRANGAPSDADISEALADHLCRCGTHRRVIAAIRRAAQEVAHG